MPRFAILSHDHPFPHWDFLLEDGDACKTWRLLTEPSPNRAVPAEQIADHRLLYLDYEGPVSGDRGTVTQFDAGCFEWLRRRDNAMLIALYGKRIEGGCTIGTPGDGRWLVWFHDRP